MDVGKVEAVAGAVVDQAETVMVEGMVTIEIVVVGMMIMMIVIAGGLLQGMQFAIVGSLIFKLKFKHLSLRIIN